MSDYELIVIGAGPGGYVAALHAAKLEKKTAVIEFREAGGTCLNRGCIPTKTLLHSSEIYHAAVSGENAGIIASDIRYDLRKIFDRKNEVSAKLSAGIEGLFKSSKIDYIRGKGQIIKPGCVTVTGADGEMQQFTADNILVATGSVPAMPPIPGLDLPGVLTSDQILEGSDELYKSIVIIGGGVIGVEFATFYNDLGCDVTIVEGLDRLLPNMDRELGQNLAQIMKKRGVKINLNAMVKSVEKSDFGMRVNFTQKDAELSAEGEVVLCAIGRSPYLGDVFADGLAPEMNRRSLKVDEHFMTSIPGIYAVGDVSSKVQLAHVASAQGTACVDMMFGHQSRLALNLVPGCIYCRPEIASVGMTEAEAKDAGLNVKIGKVAMHSNARSIISEADRSFIKLVADADTGCLIGAQLMCERSTDMISQLSQAIAAKMTPSDLLTAMRPHPTFEEALGDALEELSAKLEAK